MAHVAIEKVRRDGPESPSLVGKLEEIAERVRQRAYDIFQHRGTDGHDVEDWLQAESDLLFAPEPELVEKDGKFEIRIAAPGFKASETTVTVLPDAVIVSAESSHKHAENKGDVEYREFGTKTLFRRLELPKPVNVDKVTANLDDGVLRITAQKAHGLALAAKSAA